MTQEELKKINPNNGDILVLSEKSFSMETARKLIKYLKERNKKIVVVMSRDINDIKLVSLKEIK